MDPQTLLARPSTTRLLARLLLDVPGVAGRLARGGGIAGDAGSAAFADLVATIRRVDLDAPTACEGWTVRELLAHLAAGSEEIAELGSQALAGQPVRPTRGFGPREAPYRTMGAGSLRRAFVVQSMRATNVLTALRRRRLDVPFTGAELSARSLAAHGAAELAIHHWDITGTTPRLRTALSERWMVDHVVDVVAHMRPAVMPYQLRSRRHSDPPVLLRASAEGHHDLLLHGGELRRVAGADASTHVVTLDPAARLLVVWGREPDSTLGPPEGGPDAVAAAWQAFVVRTRALAGATTGSRTAS